MLFYAPLPPPLSARSGFLAIKTVLRRRKRKEEGGKSKKPTKVYSSKEKGEGGEIKRA